jgi:uncharacterized protein
MSLIPGPCGSIDTFFHKSNKGNAPFILLVPPHPINEGPMNCASFKNLIHMFVEMGFSVMTFNYRGIGYSDGNFVESQGEISDAAACIDWVKQKVDSDSFFWIMGYSFGAHIALQVLMRRPEIGRFIVADLDTTKDFSFLAPCPTSGLFLQSEQKNASSGELTRTLIRSLSFQTPINDFVLHNIDSPSSFEPCFFSKSQGLIKNYILNDGYVSQEEVSVPAA